jgi:hypothetical protein
MIAYVAQVWITANTLVVPGKVRNKKSYSSHLLNDSP